MTDQAAPARRPRVLMLGADEMLMRTRILQSAASLARQYEVLALGIWRRKFDLDRTAGGPDRAYGMAWADVGWTTRLGRNPAGYAARYLKVGLDQRRQGLAFAPDFIHAHEWVSLPIARMIQRATGARLIYDAHELYRDTAKATAPTWRLLARLETAALAHCDGVIACNEDRARIMHEEYGAPLRPVVIPNIPPGRAWAPSDKLREVLGERAAGLAHLVLYQGAIMAGRGLEMLPQALAELPAGIGLVMLGGGDAALQRQLVAEAADRGVGERFFSLPPVPQTELFAYTCAADVGILTYRNTCRNNYYCAPNKLYEYAAAGLPMAGADMPPIRAFLADNGVGEVFDPEDPSSLARAIGTICADREVRRRYHENCLVAGRRFTWESCCEPVLLDLYAGLAAPDQAHRRGRRV